MTALLVELLSACMLLSTVASLPSTAACAADLVQLCSLILESDTALNQHCDISLEGWQLGFEPSVLTLGNGYAPSSSHFPSSPVSLVELHVEWLCLTDRTDRRACAGWGDAQLLWGD